MPATEEQFDHWHHVVDEDIRLFHSLISFRTTNTTNGRFISCRLFSPNWAHHSMGTRHLLSFTSITLSPATTLLQSTAGTSTERTQQTEPCSNRIDLAGIFGRLFVCICSFDNLLNASLEVEWWSSSKNRIKSSKRTQTPSNIDLILVTRLALDSLCVPISH